MDQYDDILYGRYSGRADRGGREDREDFGGESPRRGRAPKYRSAAIGGDAFDDLLYAKPSGGAAPQPARPVPQDVSQLPNRSPLEVIGDTTIEAGNAVVGTVGAIGNFISPGNRVSRAADQLVKQGLANQSAQTQAAKAAYQQEQAAADGLVDEALIAGKYALQNPLLTAANIAGNLVGPGIAVKGGKMIGGALGRGLARGTPDDIARAAARGEATGAVAGGSVLGAAAGGGDAAGTAYELVMDPARRDTVLSSPQARALRAINPQLTDDMVVEQLAVAAARDASVIPAMLGAAGGAIGVERLLGGAGRGAGRLGTAVRTGAVEGVEEGIEEGATTYEGRRAAAKVDPAIDPMKGVGESAALGAIYGGGMGAVTGALSPTRATSVEPVAPIEPAAPPQPTIPSSEIQKLGVVDEAGNPLTGDAQEGSPQPQQTGGLGTATDNELEYTQSESNQQTAAVGDSFAPPQSVPGSGEYSDVMPEPDQRADIEQIADVIGKGLGVKDGDRLDVKLAVPEEVGRNRYELADRMSRTVKKLFDVDTVIADFGEDGRMATLSGRDLGPAVNGAYLNDRRTVLLNARSNDLLKTPIHEIVHALEKQQPDLYRPLEEIALKYADPRKVEAWNAALTEAGETNSAIQRSEIVAEVMAEQADPAMWDELFTRAGENAPSLRDRLVQWLNKLYTALTAEKVFVKEAARVKEIRVQLNDSFTKWQVRTAQSRSANKSATQPPVNAPQAAQEAAGAPAETRQGVDQPTDPEGLYGFVRDAVIAGTTRPSTTGIQKAHGIGYEKALRIARRLEKEGVVSAAGERGARTVQAVKPQPVGESAKKFDAPSTVQGPSNPPSNPAPEKSQQPATPEAIPEPTYDEEVNDEPGLRFARQVRALGDFRAATNRDGSMFVQGDVAEIRARLPEGVVGRPVDGGLEFTPSAAPRARAALEGSRLAYGRAGAVTKLPMKDGKYIGAPEKFNTPAKIPQLRRWLRRLTDEGAPGRFWYENSSREVLKFVGGDVNEARKFVALLAIYSPQAKVGANSTFALRAWAQYKSGHPIKVKTRSQDQKATNAMADVDAFWSGEKTGNFFFNLLREIDPSTAGRQGATIDMWMMRAGQYGTDAPTATQYAFMENETNRLAAELGWEPQQVQAAIWVAMKARMENKGVKGRTEASSERQGWITYEYPEKNGRKTKRRKILDAQKHRDNWIKHAFDHTPTDKDTGAAKFDFADGLLRHIGQISFEARPGRTTGALPGIHDAPYAQQVEFQQAVQQAFYDEDGNDLLAQKLGLLVESSDILAPGVWQGEVSPSQQKLVAMAPAAGKDGKTSVDPAQKSALSVYAAIAGMVAKQEGVGWHRPFYTVAKRDANGLDVDIGRPINPAEAADLEGAIGQWMLANGKDGWADAFAIISSAKGVRLVNFGAVENAVLTGDLYPVIERVLPDFKSRSFASDGDLITNNWRANPDGQGYASRVRAEGRSDVLDWARDFLAPRVEAVHADFARRYGWDRVPDGLRSGRDGGAGVAASASDVQLSRAAGDRGGRDQGRSLAPLPGAPDVQGAAGPDPRLVQVAEDYARRNGIPLRRQAEYVQVDPERAARIAAAYDAMPHAPQDPAVADAYQNLIRQTRAQYDALIEAGYTFTFFDSKSDPYQGNPWNAMRDLRANQRMAVYGTYDGYGTEGVTQGAVDDNPMLVDTGLRWPDQTGEMRPVLANDLFRAVHDAFGHGLEGAGFRAQGEENAWQAHVRLFTGSAIGAITSETRGQNSWLNYGPYGEKNRNAKLEDTVFADQKTGLMPEWTWAEGRAADETDGGVQLSRARQYEAQDAGDAPVFQDRPTQPGSAEFVGYHYSAVPRAQLSGMSYGSATSATKGKEYERVMQSKDRRIRDRVYFYTAPMADIPRSEPVVTGAHIHKVVLKNIWDPRLDDDRPRAGGSFNESALLDAGYDGYVSHEAGMIVVLNTRPVPVRHIGNRQGLREQIQPNPVLTGAVKIEYPSRAVVTRDGMLTKKPDAGQWVGGAAEAAVRAAAPSFTIEYGEMKVRPEEAQAANEALRAAGNDFQFSRNVWDNPRFRSWFGDSKIVDAPEIFDDGPYGFSVRYRTGPRQRTTETFGTRQEAEAFAADKTVPKVMYHGTARDIQAFRAKQAGAIFVTEDPGFAAGFSEGSEEWMTENAEQFLTPAQMSMAIDRAVTAARKSQVYRTMKPLDQGEFIADIRTGKPKNAAASVILGKEVRTYLPSGQNIIPLYVRAENPFDYENSAKVDALVQRMRDEGYGDLDNFRERVERGDWTTIENEDTQAALKALGHDAFHVREGGQKNLAVYLPTQLKSAIGNNGEYDPSVPDIRYSRPVSAQGSQFTLPERSIKERAANLLTNEMSRMKDIREDVGRQGGSLSDDNDVDMQNRLSIRMAGTKVDRFRNTVVKPLVKRAEKLGKDSGARGDVLGDASLLLYAMHAPERNKYIAGINPRFPDGGSGMTNKEAKDAIDALKQKYGPANFVRLSAIANDFQAITQRTQNTLVSGDLVDPVLAQNWNGRYSSYVPLKGFEKVDDSAKETSNIDPRWDFSRRALGRESRAGQIIENILKDHERAILMVAKNDVRKSFLQFVRDNPDDKLWEINRVALTQQFRKALGLQSPVGQAQGIVTQVGTLNKNNRNTVAVRDGGQLFYITVKDEALLNDLNEELSTGTPEDAKAIFRLWKSINKNLGFVWTALSPVFVLTNFIRDLSYGTIKTARDFGVAAGAKVLGNSIRAVPSIWRAVYTNNWTGGSSEYERWFNEFREQGGAMGLVSQLSVDEQHERLMDSFRAYEGALKDDWKTWGRPALKYVTAIKDFVVNANSGIEQAVRVAAYAEARKRGEPPKKAADIAANVTVDFARRGKLGPLLGSLYLFYNPAVQGTANLMEVVKGKRGAAVVGSLIALGFMWAMMASSAEGDDEEPYWDQPNQDQAKLKNLVWYSPTGDRYSIPIPYGMGFFVNLGHAIHDLGRGKDPWKVAAFVRNSLTQHFSPLGSPDNLVTFFAPTILDPVAVATTEQREDGKPMLPKDFLGNTPDSQRFWTSTRGTATERITSWMNEATGGNSSRSGLIDVSPETLNYLFSFITGGAGTTVRDLVQSLDLTLNVDGDAALEKNKWPVLRSFYRQADGRGYQSSFYENAEEVAAAVKEMKEQAFSEDEATQERIAGNVGIASMGKILNSVKKQLSDLKKQEIAIIDSDLSRKEKEDARKAIEEQRTMLYLDFNRAFYSIKPE